MNQLPKIPPFLKVKATISRKIPPFLKRWNHGKTAQSSSHFTRIFHEIKHPVGVPLVETSRSLLLKVFPCFSYGFHWLPGLAWLTWTLNCTGTRRAWRASWQSWFDVRADEFIWFHMSLDELWYVKLYDVFWILWDSTYMIWFWFAIWWLGELFGDMGIHIPYYKNGEPRSY